MKAREDFLYGRLKGLLGREDHCRDSIESRFESFLNYMQGHFNPQCPIVIVGGTNGKGEVCQGLAHFTQKEGKKVGLWTSPHIESITERYFFDGSFISTEKLEEILFSQLPKDIFKFSLFEVLFAAFMAWMKEQKVDLIILEVGLGGRLDATNVFNPSLSIITSISRDHTAYLGDSLRGILEEKMGILKEGGVFIGQSSLAYLRELMKKESKKRGASHSIILAQGKNETYREVNRRLVGKAFYQLWKKKLPGRDFPERVGPWRNSVFFNGAHNPDGMREFFKQRKLQGDLLILGFSSRPLTEVKSLLLIAKGHSFLFREVIMTYFSHERSLPLNESRQAAQDNAMVFQLDWKKKIDETLKREGKIFILGSYYFVGEVKRYLSSLPLSISDKPSFLEGSKTTI